MTGTKHPGWKPEGFMRQKLGIKDVDEVLVAVRNRIERHFVEYGDGIFTHPHEIVGCLYGQQMKLSAAADESIYSGDLVGFKERCMKMLLAIIAGTASVDKLAWLRDLANAPDDHAATSEATTPLEPTAAVVHPVVLEVSVCHKED